MPGPAVDVLVVVGTGWVPHVLEARAGRVIRVPDSSETASLIGELRGIIPRIVGVVGDAAAVPAVVRQVHDAGLATVLFTDDPVAVPAGVERGR